MNVLFNYKWLHYQYTINIDSCYCKSNTRIFWRTQFFWGVWFAL